MSTTSYHVQLYNKARSCASAPKEAYGGRSLVHNRFARRNPQACAGEDDGLFAVLTEEFKQRAKELPQLFNPKAPAIALRPSVSALKQCITLLSGRVRSSMLARQKSAEALLQTDEVFEAPDALGWAYQYWNAEEKDRVFEKIRTQKGAKIEGADIVPATQLYTEPYMVKFLVHNSLGALWMGMNLRSKLYEYWEYYVKFADNLRVGMVTQQSWMFLRSFADLRALDEEKLEKADKGVFKGLLRETSIETLAHLGPRAFNEISGEVVNIVLFTLTNTVPKLNHQITAFRLVGPKSPQEKDMLLKEAIFEQQEEVA